MKPSDDDSPHEGATFTVWYKKWNIGDWSAMGRRLTLHEAEQILDDLQYKTDCRGLGYYPLKIYPDDFGAVQTYQAPEPLQDITSWNPENLLPSLTDELPATYETDNGD